MAKNKPSSPTMYPEQLLIELKEINRRLSDLEGFLRAVDNIKKGKHPSGRKRTQRPAK